MVELGEGGKKGLVCRDARKESGEGEGEEEGFVDWREGKKWTFNHMTSVSHSVLF